MGTIYYCACLDCKSLVDLDKFYMVPSLDEYFDIETFDIETEVSLYEGDGSYNRHCIFLLTFMLRHQGHRLVLGTPDALNDFAEITWYVTYTREMEVHK